MTIEVKELKGIAEEYRALYRLNKISREEAKQQIMPYINHFNERSKEIAKKYKMKPKTITFAKFIR